jgi:hypothetical protein
MAKQVLIRVFRHGHAEKMMSFCVHIPTIFSFAVHLILEDYLGVILVLYFMRPLCSSSDLDSHPQQQSSTTHSRHLKIISIPPPLSIPGLPHLVHRTVS